MKLLSLTILVVILAFADARAANTTARLILPVDSAKAGETIWAGVELDMAPHWHTYWRFPGNGGLGIATTVSWTLPKGASAGGLQWPVPEKFTKKVADTSIVTYIYNHQVVLLSPIELDPGLPAGPVRLQAALAWLECEDGGQCVPQKSEVSATLRIGPGDKPSPDAPLIQQWLERLPKTNAAPQATMRWDAITPGDTRAVILDWISGAKPGDFYPYEHQLAEVGGETEYLSSTPGHMLMRKVVTKGEGDWPKTLRGMLVEHSDTPEAMGVEVDLPIQPPAPVTAVAGGGTTPLALMLLFALAGGLVLNVMPCVLPVIALKVLGFVNQAKEEPGRVRRLGLVYGAGVLASFLALAVAAILVQKAGGVAGWGDLMRIPKFQFGVTVLLTLIALNLFGVFEVTLGGGVMGAASGLASRQGYGGAFFNGAFATLLATPCTAPFLGPAIAFALTQPASVTLLIYLFAGLGLALPFVVICFRPVLLKALPKPGAWMEKLKIAFGFPMLGAAVWLAWVASKTESDLFSLGLFLVLLALAAWVWGEFAQRGQRRILAAVVCLALLAGAYEWLLAGSSETGIVWQQWSLDNVEKARREGHPVLVDFTAKSCVTCMVNKKTSIEIDRTRAKLKDIDAVAFAADYTDQDPAIARELQRYGSSGVPLVLVYSKDLDKPPQVLPTLLTPDIVLKALDQAAN